jgi:hypothetical protein
MLQQKANQYLVNTQEVKIFINLQRFLAYLNHFIFITQRRRGAPEKDECGLNT